MKKLIFTLIALLFLCLATQAFAITGAIGATALTGGVEGALDWYDGSTLNDGDQAEVSTNGLVYFYWLDDDSAAAESSPGVISPDSNAGDKRWLLQDIGTGLIAFGITDGTPSVLTGSKFTTADTTKITDFDDGYAGKIITVLSKHTMTFDTTTAQDADHNLDGSAGDIVTATGDITVWLCEDGTTWHFISGNDASADNSF